MRLRLVVLLFCLSILSLKSQVDSLLPDLQDNAQQLAEDFLQNTDSEGSFDFNTLFEGLEAYLDRPLNLNKASELELREMGLLSDIQILELINYRATAGDLIAIYELQAIPSFDLQTIRNLVPYVSVSGGLDDYQISLGKMLREGKNELYLRWSKVLEEQKGFSALEPGETAQRYLGDPNQYYVRFKHSASNRLSYGFTAEKDRGEEFFSGSNKNGFDFYSAHFFLKDYSKNIKAIALGDFAVSFGQGLILFSGFGYGKSAFALNVKRNSRTLRQYSSVNESNFMRGAGATIAFGSHLEATAFASYIKRDGNLAEPDTSEVDAIFLSVTSLDSDGLHRTSSEIADEKAIGQFTTGGSLKWQARQGHIAFNALYDQLDVTLQRTPAPYNRFYFNGDHLLNLSVDYSYIFQNYNFFGETARSENGSIATINGLLIGLDKKIDMALLFRHFPRDYQALNATPFAETSGARNETGFYMGIGIYPSRNWIISAYYDIWRHPWLRFGVDAPSMGQEYRVRLTYFIKRKMETYLEVRNQVREENVDRFEEKTNFLLPTQAFQARLHLSYQVSKALELRSRIDYGFADNPINNRQDGIAFYQDILYKPLGTPFSFSTRFAIFDTDGFQVRFYAYENGLLYTPSIPAYYNRGTRFYFNLRYRGFRDLTLEARIAQTYWKNEESIGSSLEEIEGPVRTQVSAQVKYQF
ncbi:MAG TPA: helix-hairpin-helix domain-containing protein [Saprospiraceae bacterium]|nr:helix-hairpin-helix domain-containing protein [Saprospiraceae bacterium]HMQ81489.1 helix-hairpin-helix domain-containing protein [Saprospiraceae bacterium]